ncbi:trinucleotide repeat-containing gene 6B protein-like [Salvelinus fontinalis]|uniref:trinucleotide repeat-containing gene 6B protein-like n=1 Tax=Salvelinus fontinalis TaxID=8038 RepID=UPI002486CBE7|nr:trinucleotide repeat-containing gene 6B protein-like [Salvelinus fontinalis]
MEDKKKKKEDKKKREASQKVTEQKVKVPESTKASSTQSLATPGSVSPSPGPTPPPSPCPAAGFAVPPGGNNANRAAVANGQPPTGTQRYMPREVPPRFRYQQDHKVLLKRGQPPLSCMLLGGGSGRGDAPPLSQGDAPNATTSGSTDPNLGSPSPSPPHSSPSSSVAASSTYANSSWGLGSGSQPPSQGWEKVIVDGSDLEEWPSIVGGDRVGNEGAELDVPNNSSASRTDKCTQQHLRTGGARAGSSDSPSPPHSSPSSLTECVLSGVVWGSSSQPGIGVAAAATAEGPVLNNSKVSFLPGTQESPLSVNSGIPGANFNPNANPSAWPALVQDGTTGVGAATTEAVPSSITTSVSASTTHTHPLSSVNQASHQHQLHEMPARDGEHLHGDWGGLGPELGEGPNQGGTDLVDSEVVGGSEHLSASSSSSTTSSSSWRALPPPSNLNTGASKTDGWNRVGGDAAQGEEANVWGFGSQGEKAGLAGDEEWVRGNDVSSNTPVVSQGAWDGATEEGWGGTQGSTDVRGSSNPAIGSSVGGESSSSSGGGGGGGISQDSASPTFATMTTAWDNQKGVDAIGEWAGQGGRGSGDPSSSSGGGSRAGSHNRHQEHSRHRSSNPPPNPEVALQSVLSRSDLDPRVLSNTGWGQIQVQQNVAWDLDTGAASQNEGSSSPAFPSQAVNSTGRASTYPASNSTMTTDLSAGAHMPTTNTGPGPVSSKGGWDDESNCAPPSNMRNSTASRMPVEDIDGSQGKTSGAWGDVSTSESHGKGWGSEEQEGRDRRGGGGSNWRDFGEQGGGRGSGWGGGQEEKGTAGGWKEMGREGGGWGQKGGGNWAQREPKTGNGGWGEGRGRGGGNTDKGSWGNIDEGGQQRSWGSGGDMGGKPHQDWCVKPHSPQIPNSQAATLKSPNQQQHQSQTQQPPGGLGRSGGPHTQNQNQNSGWTAGPIPQIPVGPAEAPELSGWEEPSPQSISRKMEIDDGTSAWGDPTCYNSKNVNLWDKNSAPSGQPPPLQGKTQQGPPTSVQQPPPRRQPVIPANRDSNPGNAPGMGPPGMWGGGGNLIGQSVDNGTASWGQTSDPPSGWGDPDNSSKTAGWGNPSSKSGSKSVQETWGKGEGPVPASRHSSWDEEEDVGGVWNSTGSQTSSNYNSGGWGQGPGGKRGNIKGGGGDNWMNPMTRQFQNMGLMGEDLSLDKKLEGDKRGMNDYSGEMRRGGRGGGGYRMPSSKDMGPGDMGPYSDKVGGHGLFSGSGGMPQSRGMRQPGMHPMNPPQGLRGQVPHQFLSAQVPGPMLKQIPSPGSSVGGVGGGVFPPQLSPQQLAVLSNIYPHVQQFHLACQLLLQQQQQQLLQNQRKLPQPIRQQTDPQQLARIMAILQQQRQQQQGVVGGGSGSSKLSPSLGGAPKQPMADSIPHPGMGGPLLDLHAKTQGMYSGLAPGGNLSGLELGSMVGGVKDGGGQQSRFKWMMEGHSPAPSPPDTAHHKNGPLPMAMKVREGSPYSQYELLGVDGLGMPPQGPSDNWHRTPGSKMGTMTGTSSWPPEFQPGVPWKGIQSADPESDPYMTPGSVLGSHGPSSLSDSDHQLLRDNAGPNPSLNTLLPSPGAWPYSASDNPLGNAHSTAKYSEYKPSWPPEPIGHNKPWKTSRVGSQLPRPPPGLTSQKQASTSLWGSGAPRLTRGWGEGGGSQDSRFGTGSAWNDGVASRGSCWLLLSNLTPQIDGSTLRTICMQHGPLLTFHLGLTQGSALIRYSTRQEAAKAQGALHMCVLGNTTILAEFVSEEEVARYFAHSQVGGAEGASPGAGAAQGSSGTHTVVGNSGGGSLGSERAAIGAGNNLGGNRGGGVLGSVGPSSSGWQSLDGTGSSPEATSAQGPGLGIFAQLSANGAGKGVGGGVGRVEAGRSGLWGGVTPGYSSSSLWGAPQMEDRHQIGSPAALLPGDLLGGGADSI